ncbi:MAG: hypothetical protein C0449_01045 [Polaromonas sp.]|nr:hypothetical protein [Polaromonas sp.]
MLVSFSATPHPAYDLQILTNDQFSFGMGERLITNADDAVCMPPWLERLEGKNLDRIDLVRDKAKIEHAEIAHKRHFCVAEVLQRWPQLLLQDDFIRAMNAVIRGIRPSQNETRVRLWFFTYLAFAQNIWSLLPAYFEENTPALPVGPTSPKRGRPSNEGNQHGFNCDGEMVEKCVDGYRSFPEKGKAWYEIYAHVLNNRFGCVAHFRNAEDFEIRQPEGKPYPSLGQFEYYVRKAIPQIERDILRFGKTRTRNRNTAPEGSYTAELAYLMEKFEVDAFTVEAHPTSIKTGGVAPRLYVVRIICIASGLIVGIGFGFGSEDADAYKSALFCACVDKAYFCSLYGLKIEPGQWPSIGLGLEYIPDRGHGSCDEVVEKLKGLVGVTGMPPTSEPQSHGSIESSHPREPKREGIKFYKVSRCDAIGLARACILEVSEHNAASDCTRRLTLEMSKAHVVPTPIGIWNYLDDIGRNAAQSVELKTAVRLFTTPVEFKMKRGQLLLGSTNYTSEELKATGLLDQSKRLDAIPLEGFALRMCARKTWICIGMDVMEVELNLPYRSGKEQKFIPLSQVLEHAQVVTDGVSKTETRKAAAKLHTMQSAKDTISGANTAPQERKGAPNVRSHDLERERRTVARKRNHGGAK